jgi:nucleotide-binding universal stress UspA family protein
VCGVDGSRQSCRAAVTALSLADRVGADLVLVHVLPPRPSMTLASVPVGAHPVTAAQMRQLDRLDAEGAFAAVEPQIPSARAERRIERGDAVERLSAIASELRASLLVVGSRGRGPLSGAVLGSVSAELARRGPCPVVIVPPGATLGLADQR